MGIFLVDEGTVAVGMMALVFTIGLLGVAALGWYVVRCDTQNRHAERDLLLAESQGTVSGPLEGRAPDGHASAGATASESPSSDDTAPAVADGGSKGH